MLSQLFFFKALFSYVMLTQAPPTWHPVTVVTGEEKHKTFDLYDLMEAQKNELKNKSGRKATKIRVD